MAETVVEYIQKLRENTFANMQKKREKQQRDNEQRDELLKESLDHLESYILSFCKDKMMHASNYGHFYTKIMEFSSFDMFDDHHKIVYLLRGPMKSRNKHHVYGLEYFKERDIIPVLDRLNVQMNPIDFHLKYDRVTQKHTMYANWFELGVNNPLKESENHFV
jgi:hypothetical protein